MIAPIPFVIFFRLLDNLPAVTKFMTNPLEGETPDGRGLVARYEKGFALGFSKADSQVIQQASNVRFLSLSVCFLKVPTHRIVVDWKIAKMSFQGIFFFKFAAREAVLVGSRIGTSRAHPR